MKPSLAGGRSSLVDLTRALGRVGGAHVDLGVNLVELELVRGGLLVGAGFLLVLQTDILGRVSYALALGAIFTVLAQTVFLVMFKRRRVSTKASSVRRVLR